MGSEMCIRDRPWSMVHAPCSMDHGSWTMLHGPWTVVHGPWTGLWTMVHGSWSRVHGEFRCLPREPNVKYHIPPTDSEGGRKVFNVCMAATHEGFLSLPTVEGIFFDTSHAKHKFSNPSSKFRVFSGGDFSRHLLSKTQFFEFHAH